MTQSHPHVLSGSTRLSRRSFIAAAVSSVVVVQTSAAASLNVNLTQVAGRGARLSKSAHVPVKAGIRFFTNRRKMGTDTTLIGFSNARGIPILGKAIVSLKSRRRITIPAEAELKQLELWGESQFYGPAFGDPPRSRDATLFVHGYNYSFEDAIFAAARLKAIIDTGGPMFVHSWPSWAGPFGYLGYLYDVEELDFAASHLQGTLIEILKSPNFDRVQIVAHSLGARAVVKALGDIYKSDRQLLKRVTAVVLAAPDVEHDVVDRDYLPAARYAGFKTCLYVSNKDIAMWISEKAHFRPRAGSTNKAIYTRKEVETVEVGAVDPSRWGHSAIFESRIASDMRYFLKFHIPAKDRWGLRPSEKGPYFCMNL